MRDVGATAQLIGQRGVARGVAERERGKLVRILEPTGGIAGVTADEVDEVDEFLAEIRG